MDLNCIDINVVNLLLTIVVVIIGGLSLYISLKTYLLTLKKPLVKCKSALDSPIKFDPAKIPSNEKYIRVIITNPSLGNIGIKIEAFNSKVLKCLRGAPVWKKETDNFEKKIKYSGDYLTLTSGETIYFDYFLLEKTIDSIRGESIMFEVKDNKGRKIKKKLKL